MGKYKFICDECKNVEYEKVDITETVNIKGTEITNEHQYYKCNKCGELYEPFEDPDKNLRLDYDMYRKLNGLLTTNEIIEIREKYSVSQRLFAEILGISHSTLSNIENGAIHTKYQDTLFIMANEPYAFRDLFMKRETYLNISDAEKEKIHKNIDILCVCSDAKHKEVVKKVVGTVELLRDQTNDVLRRVNMVEASINEYGKSSKENSYESTNKEVMSTWTKKIWNTIGLL